MLEKMLLPYTSNRGERIVAYIDENFCGELGIQKICEDINVSKNVLYRFIREKFGCTVSEYINRKRIAFAQGLLKGTDLSVEEISQKCGFSSTSYFTRTFKKQIGITPLKFKNHNDAKKDS